MEVTDEATLVDLDGDIEYGSMEKLNGTISSLALADDENARKRAKAGLALCPSPSCTVNMDGLTTQGFS